jgi:hypothetical protein
VADWRSADIRAKVRIGLLWLPPPVDTQPWGEHTPQQSRSVGPVYPETSLTASTQQDIPVDADTRFGKTRDFLPAGLAHPGYAPQQVGTEDPCSVSQP